MQCVLEKNEYIIAARLYAESFNTNEVSAKSILEGFAGTVYAFKENNNICGILCAAQITVNKKNGLLLHGGTTLLQYRHMGIYKALVEYALQNNQSDFFIVNNCEGYEAFYEKLGFKGLYVMRSVNRTIQRNLWARASFDTVTAKKLYENRKKYISNNYVQLSVQQIATLLSNLYSKGISTAETEKAYALYYRLRDKLLITELYAESEAEAWYLLEAIADRDGRDNAQLILSGENTVFSGEGSRFCEIMALGLEINELQYSGYLPE